MAETEVRAVGESGRGSAGAIGLKYHIGDDLWIEEVNIADLKEQEVNANVMKPATMQRLTENILKRKHLESVPYCAQPNGEGPIEIVSGHHRVRAARSAGFTRIVALVDRSPLTRSQIVAKQLAHNALAGSDDPDILKRLIGKMTTVDDLLESGLDEKFLPTPENYKVTLFTPHADYKWKTCNFIFGGDGGCEDHRNRFIGRRGDTC
jgi:hypothetical protein